MLWRTSRQVGLLVLTGVVWLAPPLARAQTASFGSGGCTATVNPSAVDFGLVRPGGLYTQRMIVAAVGPTVRFIRVALAAGSSSAFSGDGRLGPVPLDFQLSFAPTKAGEHNGALAIRALDANQVECASTTVSLAGAAVVPFELSSYVVDFGFQQVGTTSAPKKVSIKTNGSKDFIISSSAAAFPVTPEKYAGPKDTEITVVFKPDKKGNYSGAISVFAKNADIKLPIQTITVRGTGTVPPKITTASADFPRGRVGDVYRHLLESSGGWSTVYWSVMDVAALPPGLQLGSGGILAGVPQRAGSYTFRVKARDGRDIEDQVTFTIHIDDIATIRSVVDSASLDAKRPLAAGAIVSLFGALGPRDPLQATTQPLPLRLGDLQILFVLDAGGEVSVVPAPLFYASAEQVNLQVPWEAAGADSVAVKAGVGGYASLASEVRISPVSPSIFTLSGQGTGRAVAVNVDGSLAQPADCCGGAPARPAAIGRSLVLYANGLGELEPSAVTGAADGTLRRVVLETRLWIGAVEVPVAFAGEAPGLVGVNQVNVLELPAEVKPGEATPIWIETGGVRSQNGVTLAIAPAEPGP